MHLVLSLVITRVKESMHWVVTQILVFTNVQLAIRTNLLVLEYHTFLGLNCPYIYTIYFVRKSMSIF